MSTLNLQICFFLSIKKQNDFVLSFRKKGAMYCTFCRDISQRIGARGGCSLRGPTRSNRKKNCGSHVQGQVLEFSRLPLSSATNLTCREKS